MCSRPIPINEIRTINLKDLSSEVVANNSTVYPMFKKDVTSGGCTSKYFVTTYEIVLEKEGDVKYGFDSNIDGNTLILAFGNAWAPSYTITEQGIVG